VGNCGAVIQMIVENSGRVTQVDVGNPEVSFVLHERVLHRNANHGICTSREEAVKSLKGINDFKWR